MDELKNFLFSGDADAVTAEVSRLLSAGKAPDEIMNDGLIAGMSVIGEQFKNNEIFIPEVLISADSMHAGLDVLRPYLEKAGVKPKGKVVIGTVKGDLHDIGKNFVLMMLKGAGFLVEDCGIDCPPAKFVQAIRNSDADILAMSSLLTTSMPSMKETVDALCQNNLRDRVKIMVGGAPLSKGFADEIGADCYGKDAADAVDIANNLIGMGTGVK